ncbi:MAG: DUF3368 domain-containing protein [Acidobacteria bacterium]|nr:DUF3368 domain-containing protein [Acidobacteriota bacterium]
MIAVVDASPLCYLLLIGEIDLLPQLFSRVVVPQAVIVELQHEDAPATVRNWACNPPIWISVEETPDTFSEGMEKLQAGERSAILLAESIEADIIVIDEKAARQIANHRGLCVTGVLGVIGEAASLGLVDLTQAIDRLRKTSFRCSPALFKATLEKYGRP